MHQLKCFDGNSQKEKIWMPVSKTVENVQMANRLLREQIKWMKIDLIILTVIMSYNFIHMKFSFLPSLAMQLSRNDFSEVLLYFIDYTVSSILYRSNRCLNQQELP